MIDNGPSSAAEFGPSEAIAHVRALRAFYWLLAASLTASSALFFLWTWRWPLVADASAMHYVIFLIQHGWVPYRQIPDQQFPGAYAVEFLGMHIFGAGSLGWRLYDFALLAVATVAFFGVTRAPATGKKVSSRAATASAWMPGLFAACLFILIHGRDGLEQTGQRDFMIAVLLLGATAVLFAAVPRSSGWRFAVFGLLSGLAASIKPTVLPLSAGQLAFSCYVLRHHRGGWVRYAVVAMAGYVVAPTACLVFLIRERALTTFLAGLRGILPYYASLGHRSLGYILIHSVSPVLLMVYLWIALQLVNLPAIGGPASWVADWRRTMLVGSAAFALLDCVLQARALPYYRYPLLAFLLPLIAVDFFRALNRSSDLRQAPASRKVAVSLAFVGVFFGGFIVAAQSARLIHRYRWQETDFITSLERDLTQLGGRALSRHIQFLDSIGGCPAVFYDMRLEPTSGVLDDYVLFGSESIPIVRQTREQFSREIFPNPPQVIVISSRLHLSTLEDFHKLERWPALADFLASRYTLATEWHPRRPYLWWSRPEWPASYRIYVLRSAAATAPTTGAR